MVSRKTFKKSTKPRRVTFKSRGKGSRRKGDVTTYKPSMSGSKKESSVQYQKGYLPFAQKFMVRLPYVENYAISADGTTGLTSVQNTFSLNNLFDPRYNVGGHQPLQYDSISPAYERVWCWGAKVVLTFSNPTYDGMYVGYRVRGNTNSVVTTGQNLEYIQEMRESKIKPLNGSGSQTCQFKFYVDNPKVLGVTKGQYNNLEYSHPVNNNPAVLVWLEPFALHSVSGETGVVRCNVNITYYAQMTNPISQAQS